MAESIIPPVNWSGALKSTYRLTMPDSGLDATDITNTVELDFASYIWRPWLATWTANLNLSRATSETDESESSSELLSGQGQVNLFPRSHFPGALYFSHSDSQLDGEKAVSGYITTRFGARQVYLPKSGRSSYRGNIERNIQQNVRNNTEDITDILQLGTAQNWEKQQLTANLLVRSADRQANSDQEKQFILTGTHDYHFSDQLVIESNAEFSTNSNQNLLTAKRENQDFHLRTNVRWDDDELPLRARALADYRSSSDKDETGESDSETLSLDADVSYDFTDSLRLNASAGVTTEETDSNTSLTTDQSVSVSYSPTARDLSGFLYNWSTSAGVSNQTSSEDDGDWGANWLATHSINRNFILSEEPSVSLLFNASQSATSDYRKNSGNLNTVNHNASANLVHNFTGGSNTLRISASDIWITGATSLHTQVLGITGSHSQVLGRYEQLSANFNIGLSSVSTDETSGDNIYSQANLTYNNRRFFKQKGLRFESKLEMDSQSFYPFDLSADDASIQWRNELNYTIGRLETKLITNITESSGGKSDKSIFLSTQRNF